MSVLVNRKSNHSAYLFREPCVFLRSSTSKELHTTSSNLWSRVYVKPQLDYFINTTMAQLYMFFPQCQTFAKLFCGRLWLLRHLGHHTLTTLQLFSAALQSVPVCFEEFCIHLSSQEVLIQLIRCFPHLGWCGKFQTFWISSQGLCFVIGWLDLGNHKKNLKGIFSYYDRNVEILSGCLIFVFYRTLLFTMQFVWSKLWGIPGTVVFTVRSYDTKQAKKHISYIIHLYWNPMTKSTASSVNKTNNNKQLMK